MFLENLWILSKWKNSKRKNQKFPKTNADIFQFMGDGTHTHTRSHAGDRNERARDGGSLWWKNSIKLVILQLCSCCFCGLTCAGCVVMACCWTKAVIFLACQSGIRKIISSFLIGIWIKSYLIRSHRRHLASKPNNALGSQALFYGDKRSLSCSFLPQSVLK